MKIIDITGPIYSNMWNFGFPDGQFRIMELDFEFLGHRYFHEGFLGLVGTTGTYIETGATYHGYKKTIPTHKIPLERLVNIDSYVIDLNLVNLPERDNRKYIRKKDITSAEKGIIPDGRSIIICTGHSDEDWDSKDYVDKSPYFSRDALFYLLDKNPNLLASDFPTWENRLNPENTLERMYSSDVIILANCMNLKKINNYNVKLTAVPLNIINVSTCPARAFVIEED